MIGQTISHYKILEKLGEGGMGIVYKAQDTRLDRIVALKFLPRELTCDEEAKNRFVREAQAASKLDSPNICTIYDVDEASNGSSYIVMAYCDGEALSKKIRAGALSIEQAVDIALQVCQGLSAAHQKGIIHRDLKPGNILLTQDGGAKIIDFGLAKLAGGARLTRTGTTVGTAAYMSPEQTRGEDIDERTDIWSLGVILYEMLSGKLPFPGEFESALMYSICNERPIPIETIRPDVSLELRLVIDRALEKDRAKRYQTVVDVITELRAIRSKYLLTSVAESDWQAVSRSVTYVIKRHRVAVLIGAAVIAIVILGVLSRSLFVKPKVLPSLVSKSIAVIPIGTTGGSQQEYFSIGFAEELIEALTDLHGVLVISPKSSIYFRESDLPDTSIAARLGVRYLVKIRFQSLTARTKLLVSMFDSESGNEVWSSNYDFARGEIFSVKETILRSVVDHLGIDEATFKPPKYKTSPDVYDTYLDGLYYRDKQTRNENLVAISYLSEAIRRDSQYLPAVVALANAQVEQFRQGWDRSEKLIEEAERNCKIALRIDTTNSAALALMGLIMDLRGNPTAATGYLLKAYDQDKNNATALTVLGFISLFETGEPAKGVMYLQQLQKIEPYDWLTVSNIGVAFAQIKNYPEAIRAFRRASQINPDHEWPPYSLGYTYERLARLDSAEYYYQTALAKNPSNGKTYDALASILLASNKYSTAESTLNTALRYLQGDPQILYDIGLTYAFQGKHEPARRAFLDGTTLLEGKLRKNPHVGEDNAMYGLFMARLGQRTKALAAVETAFQIDSTNEEVIIRIARVHSILNEKQNMLRFFKRAKTMNPEYDVAYVSTAMDFEKYRKDPDLLAIARQE